MPTLLQIAKENTLAGEVSRIKVLVIAQVDRTESAMNELVQLKTDNPAYATEIQSYINAAKDLLIATAGNF